MSVENKTFSRDVYLNDDSFQEGDIASLAGGVWAQGVQKIDKYILVKGNSSPITCVNTVSAGKGILTIAEVSMLELM